MGPIKSQCLIDFTIGLRSKLELKHD